VLNDSICYRLLSTSYSSRRSFRVKKITRFMEHVNSKGFIRILFPSSRIAFKIQWMATSLFKSIPFSVFLLLTRPRKDGRALNSSCLVLSCFSLSYRKKCKLHSLVPFLSKLSFLVLHYFECAWNVFY